MQSHILESISGIQNFLVYFVSSVSLLALFSYVYNVVTPYPELKLIREGKVAPAISYGGAMVGFIFPLSSAISHSVSLVDMFIWAAIALVVQILTFIALKAVYPGLVNDVADNKIAPATFMAFLSMGVGWLNAASMSY